MWDLRVKLLRVQRCDRRLGQLGLGSRLRRRIDEALQQGAGKALIETGAGTEYRLRLSRKDVGAREAFFRELPPVTVAKDFLEILKLHCKQV